MSKKLEFINIENKDFINQYFYRYKILENKFENFKNILINYIKDMNKWENKNEDSLVANCLSPFFKKLNFETHIKYKMKEHDSKKRYLGEFYTPLIFAKKSSYY